MSKITPLRTGVCLALFVAAAILVIVTQMRTDPWRELRGLGGVQSTTRDGLWKWYDFQFPQPCRSISADLVTWKSKFASSNPGFMLTDLEDRDYGPEVFATLSELAVRPPPEFRPGMNCGFTVGVQQPKSWIETVRGWLGLGL